MNNLGYAFRQLVRRPGLSIVVIVMLALGIGATTAIFSLFHQVLVQPLPVPEPERLVNLGAPGPKRGSTSCSNAGDCEQIFSYPMFRDLERQQSVFEGIAAHRDFNANLAHEGQASIGRGIHKPTKPSVGQFDLAPHRHQIPRHTDDFIEIGGQGAFQNPLQQGFVLERRENVLITALSGGYDDGGNHSEKSLVVALLVLRSERRVMRD